MVPTVTLVPTPTCAPRPGCLDNKPPCDIAEPPGGWCSGMTPTPTGGFKPTETPTPGLGCFDSDGGKNYEVKGYVNNGVDKNIMYWDRCVEVGNPGPTGGGTIDGGAIPIYTKVEEYFCNGLAIESEVYVCPNSCVDGACVKGVAPTPTPVGGCKECPSDFACYFNGNEYRWFVTGYVGNGFVPAGGVNCGGGPQPKFRGKAGADANCDGYIDGSDYSIWRSEYVDRRADKIRDRWEADVTGGAGVDGGRCDGYVDGVDYSLWRRQYTDL